jgi:hypothetical protein
MAIDSVVYAITATWSVSSTGTISVYHWSKLELMIDIDGDGQTDQWVEPFSLEHTPFDYSAPARVSDLSIASVQPGAATLAWTAPVDDETKGTAAFYDIRYSSLPMTYSNRVSATQVVGAPVPSAAGTL